MLLSGEADTTQAVASVAGKEYSSLDDALAAAKDGDTVKVLADTTMTTGRVDGKSITLDLNGCSVQVDNRAFNVVNKGTLTLDDTAVAGSLVVKKNGKLSLGIVTGSGLQVDESGSLAAVDAKLVANGDKVVDGVYAYDVVGAVEITEADLLALVGMNVDVEKSGYAVKVDASNLPTLNKAIGAKDTKTTFSFVYTAVKDGVQTFAADEAVESLTATVKLVDSSSTGDSGAGNAGGTAGSAGDDRGSKDKAVLAAAGDDATVAAGVAGAAALAGAAVAAGAVALSRRRSID